MPPSGRTRPRSRLSYGQFPASSWRFWPSVIWGSTHALDPYKPLESGCRARACRGRRPELEMAVYLPGLRGGIGQQTHLPGRPPVDFTLTSDSIMNSFFIPQLGSQIYTMAGMQTQLHLIANSVGTYAGESSNFSGPGFLGHAF